MSEQKRSDRGKRKAVYLAAAFLMVSLLIGRVATPQKRKEAKKREQIVRAFIIPSKCECLGEHGDVYIVFVEI